MFETQKRDVLKLERSLQGLEGLLESLRSKLDFVQREKANFEATLEKVKSELRTARRSETVTRLFSILNSSGMLASGTHVLSEKTSRNSEASISKLGTSALGRPWEEADERVQSQLSALKGRMKATLEAWKTHCVE